MKNRRTDGLEHKPQDADILYRTDVSKSNESQTEIINTPQNKMTISLKAFMFFYVHRHTSKDMDYRRKAHFHMDLWCCFTIQNWLLDFGRPVVMVR